MIEGNPVWSRLYSLLPTGILKRILLDWRTHREGGVAWSRTLRDVMLEVHGVRVGYGSYGACFDSKAVPRNTVFGRYCSVADELRVFRANHLVNEFTTHPILYNPQFGYVQSDLLSRPVLNVGDDVWIGARVTVLPKCLTIGRGAIIGAGSVVVGDIPPYAIAVGNPARIARMRFSPQTIEVLEKSEWWMLDRNALVTQIPVLRQLIELSEKK